MFSRKLHAKICSPRSGGSFTEGEADLKRLAVSEVGFSQRVKLYVLFDPEDGVIVDAKYQLFGDPGLIGAMEALCETVLGKHYSQAKRLSADLIDKGVRDKKDTPAFPNEAFSSLNLALEALEGVCDQVLDLPMPKGYESPPVPYEMREALIGGYPGFLKFTKEEKLKLIEDVIERDIRPYIALDGGGISVISLSDQLELTIAYEGNCTSCFSSVGTTLSYIQQVLRAQVHPNLLVTPDPTSLFT